MIRVTTSDTTRLELEAAEDGGLLIRLTPVDVSDPATYATAETVEVKLTDELHTQLFLGFQPQAAS